jgi:hypothetical protein
MPSYLHIPKRWTPVVTRPLILVPGMSRSLPWDDAADLGQTRGVAPAARVSVHGTSIASSGRLEPVQDAVLEAQALLGIVLADRHLPARVRKEASRIAALTTTTPQLVLARLEDLRAREVSRLPAAEVMVDYCRFVSIEVFWRFHLEETVKAVFATPDDYLRAVEAEVAPAQRLLNDLGPDPVVPAPYSWLVPRAEVAGITAGQARARLNMSQDPPYVVFVWTTKRMRASGVMVRVPCALDAVPSRHMHWHRGNVPDERIDGDLPRAALDQIEWLP